jgi:hypothetical protein
MPPPPQFMLPTAATPPTLPPRSMPAATSAAASLPPRKRRMQQPRYDEDEDVHATVSLPPISSHSSSRHSRVAPALSLPAPGSAVRSPGGGRSFPSSCTPVPPPRPRNTISASTRDLPPPCPPPRTTPLPRPPSQQLPSVVEAAAERRREQRLQEEQEESETVVVATTTMSLGHLIPYESNNPISLTEPRNEQERAQNLYVDAPLVPHKRGTTTFAPNVLVISQKRQSSERRNKSDPKKIPFSSSSSSKDDKSQLHFSPPPFSSASPLADALGIVTTNVLPTPEEDSIICHSCGRCRCHACRSPRRLPERWLCNNSVHVSASSVVSCLSCMCAADAVLYHCGKDSLEDATSGNVKGGKWRWAAAAALSLVFPCLCCYLPLKGCQKMTEAAYERATNNGCSCSEDNESRSSRRQQNVITSTTTSMALSSPVCGVSESEDENKNKRLLL